MDSVGEMLKNDFSGIELGTRITISLGNQHFYLINSYNASNHDM